MGQFSTAHVGPMCHRTLGICSPCSQNASCPSPPSLPHKFSNPPKLHRAPKKSLILPVQRRQLSTPIWNQLRQLQLRRPRTLVTYQVNIGISLNTKDHHLHCLETNLSSNLTDWGVHPLIFWAVHGNLIVWHWLAVILNRKVISLPRALNRKILNFPLSINIKSSAVSWCQRNLSFSFKYTLKTKADIPLFLEREISGFSMYFFG